MHANYLTVDIVAAQKLRHLVRKLKFAMNILSCDLQISASCKAPRMQCYLEPNAFTFRPIPLALV